MKTVWVLLRFRSIDTNIWLISITSNFKLRECNVLMVNQIIIGFFEFVYICLCFCADQWSVRYFTSKMSIQCCSIQIFSCFLCLIANNVNINAQHPTPQPQFRSSGKMKIIVMFIHWNLNWIRAWFVIICGFEILSIHGFHFIIVLHEFTVGFHTQVFNFLH